MAASEPETPGINEGGAVPFVPQQDGVNGALCRAEAHRGLQRLEVCSQLHIFERYGPASPAVKLEFEVFLECRRHERGGPGPSGYSLSSRIVFPWP